MYYNPYLQQQYQPQIQYQQAPFLQAPQVPQTAPTPPIAQQQPDERIWVQGEGAAQAYLVAPNSFVRLWDSTSQTFYEKRADAMGKPSMIVYEYRAKGTESSQNEPQEQTQTIDYEKQIDALAEKIRALEERMVEYESSESVYDDSTVYAVPEPVPRRSTSRGGKTGGTRKD